ncbi:MAG: hypothetical protein SGI72_02535 [Planctomycetota bacterium]|nr:hypothetical protein [Planctomycetota bacterium]
MSLTRRLSLCVAALFTASTLGQAGVLSLSAGGTFDISALNIVSIGDLAFAGGEVWVADGTSGGLVWGVNTLGVVIDTVNPAVIPGFTGGADALTTVGATGLIAFSSFGQSVAGFFSHTGGAATSYPSALGATGADFAGSLWIASGTVAGGGSTLLRLNSNTGAVELTVPVVGLTARNADIAFDPFTGGLYALCEDDQLRQLDKVTGAILATQDLAPLLIGHNTVNGGFDFDASGSKLYVATGSGAGADSIVVLDRAFSTNVCGNSSPGFVCPCGNSGNAGRGCLNSLIFKAGAQIKGSGVPRTITDTFQLDITGMTIGTSVLFFQGTALTSITFGDGVLCAGGSVVRLAVESAPAGTATYPGAGETLIHIKGLIPAGTSMRYYQGWYRDSALAFCTPAFFNLTNAVEVEWR